jgi:hypothetical protein
VIYTDKVHLVADSLDELHSFAVSIGLKRHFFEGVKKGHPHYDLLHKSRKPIYDEQGKKMIDKSIESGALIVNSKKIVEISHKMAALKKDNTKKVVDINQSTLPL